MVMKGMKSQERLRRFANQSKSCTHINSTKIFPLASPLGTNTEPDPLFMGAGVGGAVLSSPDLSPLQVGSRGPGGNHTRRRFSRIKSLITYAKRKP